MGLREKLNENPAITSVAVGALVLVALFMVYRTQCGGGGTGGVGAAPVKAFYTVDEGKTKFVDEANKVPPFDKDGKQAYKVQIYTCADGKEIVGYIERYPEAKRAEIEAAGGPSASMAGMMAREIKRPGDKAWVSMGADPAKYGKVSAPPKCPDGKTAALLEAK